MRVHVEDSGSSCVLRLTDAKLSVANGLRRACLADVTAPAFERLLIRVNTSSHTDEVLAHRLGLMPLRGAGGDGTAKLAVRCTERRQTVTMADFDWPENVQPVHLHSPLVTLTRGQALDLEVTAMWGSGSDHAKFCPCSRVALSHGEATGSYELTLDSRSQHPAVEVAIMATEQLLQSISEVRSAA